MAFSEKTADLINQLVSAEYNNACKHFGDKYNSLHEGYAVLLEEIEEVKEQHKKLRLIKSIWNEIKNNASEKMIDSLLTLMHASIKLEIAELAQSAAVVEKMMNTIGDEKYDY